MCVEKVGREQSLAAGRRMHDHQRVEHVVPGDLQVVAELH